VSHEYHTKQIHYSMTRSTEDSSTKSSLTPAHVNEKGILQ